MGTKVTVLPKNEVGKFKEFKDFKNLAEFGKYYREVDTDFSTIRGKAFTALQEIEINAYLASWHLGGIMKQFMNPGPKKVGVSADDIAKAAGIGKTTVYEQKALYENMSLEEVRAFAQRQIYKKLLYATAHLKGTEKDKVMQLVLGTQIERGDTDACIELNAKLKAILAPEKTALPDGVQDAKGGSPNPESNPKSPAATTSEKKSNKKEDNIPENMTKARTELSAIMARLGKLGILDVKDAVDDCHIPANLEGDTNLDKYMQKIVSSAGEVYKELQVAYKDIASLMMVIGSFILSTDSEASLPDGELPDDPGVTNNASKKNR